MLTIFEQEKLNESKIVDLNSTQLDSNRNYIIGDDFGSESEIILYAGDDVEIIRINRKDSILMTQEHYKWVPVWTRIFQ
jgi:hypothetical protein